MKKTVHNRPGETGFRIGDAYIWSEIRYLDSTTNYSESIAFTERPKTQPAGNIIMLDDAGPLRCVGGLFHIAVFACILVGGVALAIKMLLE